MAGDRAEYGALQNRLEYTVSNLMNVSEFTTAARSRIEDADFAAETSNVPLAAWVLLFANLFWVVIYDTQYAMVDREDDLQIGIKSTAILFGEADRYIIGLLQLVCVFLFYWVAHLFNLGLVYLFSIFLVILLFAYHLYLIRHRARENCFKAFKNNNWVGGCILLGIIFDYGHRYSY